jgi:hypothetical protein
MAILRVHGASFLIDTHEQSRRKEFWKKSKKLIIRFIKFNFVGLFVFFIGTVIFMSVASTFWSRSWLIANGAGDLLQFSIISYLTKTKRGKIFDIGEQKNQE